MKGENVTIIPPIFGVYFTLSVFYMQLKHVCCLAIRVIEISDLQNNNLYDFETILIKLEASEVCESMEDFFLKKEIAFLHSCLRGPKDSRLVG